jgi:hypothetical protein
MKHRMKPLPCILTAWLVLGAAFPTVKAAGSESPSRYEQPKLMTGTIYEANSDRKVVLYKFKRTVTRSGPAVNVVREFIYPDGKIAARESAVYEGDSLVSYDLEELQINARGTVKVLRDPKNDSNGKIFFEYVNSSDASAKKKANTESLRPNTLINDTIAQFLAAHWDDLMKGETVKCRYIAATRAETVGFKFVKQSESSWEGKPVVIIKMSASSVIIAALVDPLYFTMEKNGEHRVLQYVGRTTPKIKDGNKWKDLDAVTVFDWD